MATKAAEQTTSVKPEIGLVPNQGPKELTTAMDEIFLADAGMGLKNVSSGDFAIPFLSILQKNSPQVSRNNAKYIKGAVEGHIINTVTGEVYAGQPEGDLPGGICYIPCGFKKEMVRWKPRDSGGGLVCYYSENDPILKTFEKNERGQLVEPRTKDLIIDTAQHFGLLLKEVDGFPEYAVISMSSTQLKASRMWNTVMRRIMKKSGGKIFNPPTFSHVYRLTTIGQTKDSYDWYGWSIANEGPVTDMGLYTLAREFSQQVEKGDVKVSAPPQEFSGDDDTIGGTTTDDGSGIPF